MRCLPCSSAEVVSQAIYAEPLQLISYDGEWAQVATEIDSYRGWVRKSSLINRLTAGESAYAYGYVARHAAHIYREQDTIYGPIITLPYESRLELVSCPSQGLSERWLQIKLLGGSCGYIQKGDIALSRPLLNIEDMCAHSRFFLNLPYTWGGRSSFGYDCSGLVQMLYRSCGIYLPRDAKDQYTWQGVKVIEIEALKKGDLLFFGQNKDKIQHVGLFLGGEEFIHTCAVVENMPYVRVSRLSDREWNGGGYYGYRSATTLRKGN